MIWCDIDVFSLLDFPFVFFFFKNVLFSPGALWLPSRKRSRTSLCTYLRHLPSPSSSFGRHCWTQRLGLSVCFSSPFFRLPWDFKLLPLLPISPSHVYPEKGDRAKWISFLQGVAQGPQEARPSWYQILRYQVRNWCYQLVITDTFLIFFNVLGNH